MTKKLNDALRKQKKNTKEKPLLITGSLGIPLGGQVLVEVPNRNAFVYVKLRDNHSEVIQAFNNKVAPVYNLPVIVERVNNRYEVIGVDAARYQSNWSSFAPYLPRHGNTHSFNIEGGGGGDIVWVYPRQFMPSLILPSGSSGGPNVVMTSYILKNADGTWKYTGLTGTSDITVHKPTGTSAVMVLVYLDSQSGNPYFLVGSGSYFSESITGSSEVYQYIPSSPNTSHIPLAAVRLVSGTNIISWDNIYDVRQFIHTTPTGTGGSNIAIQDEGVAKGSVTTLNFVGDNVQATVSGNTARIFVTGSAGGGSINTGTLDARYLKLDASNDPLTGELDIISPTYGASIASSDGYSALYLGQDANGTSNDPVIYAERYSTGSSGQFVEAAYHIRDDIKSAQFKGGSLRHIFYSGSVPYRPQTIAEINPYAHATTGTPFYINAQNPISATGSFLLFERQGTEIFRVNGSGTALSNGVPLIKEAPADGQPYGRQNNGWVVLLTGTVGGGGGSVTGLGVMTRDSGVPLGTGTILDFGNNLYASISGSVVDIKAFQSWYDVKHYGATGDGTTNDTTAVQAAINAANAAGGGVVYLPAGTYSCSPLSTYSKVSIVGVGPNLSIIKARSSGSMLTYHAISLGDMFAEYRRFSLNGNSVATIGLDLRLIYDLSIDQVLVENCTTGVNFRGVLVCDFRMLVIQECSIGLDTDLYTGIQCNLNRFEACRFLECTTLGAKLLGGANVTLDGCSIEGCGTNGSATTGGVYFQAPTTGDPIGLNVINTWFENNHGGFNIKIDTAPVVGLYNLLQSVGFYHLTNKATYGLYVEGSVRDTKAICRNVANYSGSVTADFYANGADSYILLDSCAGTTGGAGTILVAPHAAATVSDTSTVDLSLSGQQISATVIPGGIKLDDLGTPDDNTDLNASTTRHGLLPKLSGNSTEFLNGLGAWSTVCAATYQRFERAVPVTSVTGTLWSVPGNVYASGSLGVFYNGLALYKNTDYEELIYVSGTYHLLFTPSTGSTHMVSYGVPCVQQSYSSTGTGGGTFDLQDSDSELLTDSDDVQLSDSDG